MQDEKLPVTGVLRQKGSFEAAQKINDLDNFDRASNVHKTDTWRDQGEAFAHQWDTAFFYYLHSIT